MVVDLPAEVYEDFKTRCTKNHILIKDKVFKLICASLEAESKPVIGKEPQNLPPFIVDDLDEPYVEPSIKKEYLEAELKPIREKVENLKSLLAECLTCSKSEQFEKIDKKFEVTAKLIDSVMVAIEKTSSAKKCDDDLKGLEYLKNPIPRLEG